MIIRYKRVRITLPFFRLLGFLYSTIGWLVLMTLTLPDIIRKTGIPALQSHCAVIFIASFLAYAIPQYMARLFLENRDE